MVDNMSAPENIYGMSPTMCPVEQKVEGKKTNYKRPNTRFLVKECKVVINKKVGAKNKRFKKEAEYLVSNPNIKIGNRVVKSI